eukprot:comp9931_c0_seq1/m.4832 comp9931_c0_seq1/g.4832  ORF comp9931_c0_seq1/g.4832 comp9931_c0_seq1/m.4832 type:complete len:182 (-) comp9931_c0_seq1:597-1142(-)
MKVWKTEHTFTHSWADVTTAFWLKYPNPHSPHVLAVDVIQRYVDPSTLTLHTVRLLKKTNAKPKLAEKLFKGKDGYVLEESTVDVREGVMKTVTVNLSYNRVLRVEEHCMYTSVDGHTHLTTEVRLVSPMWGWAKAVETVALERFKSNVQKARTALEFVLHNVVLKDRKGGDAAKNEPRDN